MRLSVRANSCRNLSKYLLQPHLVSWKPLHVVESLNIDELICTECCQGVEGVVPGVGEMSRHCSRNLVAFEKVYNLVAFPFQIWIHIPNRCKAMKMLWIMFAQKIDDEVDAVWRLLLLNLLGEPRKELRYSCHGAVGGSSHVIPIAHPHDRIFITVAVMYHMSTRHCCDLALRRGPSPRMNSGALDVWEMP
jgi:hypothetical protein